MDGSHSSEAKRHHLPHSRASEQLNKYDLLQAFYGLFFRDHPGEPLPEENFWTLWCKGRLTEAGTLTIRLGATPSGLTSAHLHHLPIFFTAQMTFLPPNQQCHSTEGNKQVSNYVEIFASICPLVQQALCLFSWSSLRLSLFSCLLA